MSNFSISHSFSKDCTADKGIFGKGFGNNRDMAKFPSCCMTTDEKSPNISNSRPVDN